ncbi:hypothetical protein Tco_0308814 [Tanacetum coccineum]
MLRESKVGASGEGTQSNSMHAEGARWGASGQKFEDLPLEQDILSFIKDLRHTGDITYLTDVNVDYLHQPWRAFATVINKCLSGKETRMDKIRLSHAQIL